MCSIGDMGPGQRPLFDAYGHPIQPEEENRDAQPRPTKGRMRLWLSRRIRKIEVIGIISLGLAIYMMQPVISSSSLTATGKDGQYGAKATFVYSAGQLPINDVAIKCITNKVIFENRYTADVSRFSSIEEYSVGRVQPGESFTAGCTFGWSMWTNRNEGVLLMGYPTLLTQHLGIKYRFNNGVPIVIPPSPASIMFDFAAAMAHTLHPPTQVDGIFLISYKWCYFRRSVRVHVIKSPGINGTEWRIAPEREGVVADASDDDGWKLHIDPKNAEFVITLKSGGFR